MEKRLTLEDAARYPRPGTGVPRRVQFTPDGRKVAYLFSEDGTLVQGLWTYDPQSGERRQVVGGAGTFAADDRMLSVDEQLRRERSRTREQGVTDYQYAQEREGGALVLLVPLAGALYVQCDGSPLTRLADSDGATVPRLSPNGRWVAFVRGGDLYVVETRGNSLARRLTSGAEDGITNGLAEYIAQEEMGRADGYWWSPDSRRLAYVHVDTRHIPVYPIMHQGRESVAVEMHRYPFAGARNAAVALGIIDVLGNQPTGWMDLGGDPDIYLARVAWRPDGVLTAQIQSRDQQTVRLVAFDEGGQATSLIEEHGEPWFNLSDDVRFLGSGEILWSSEKTGFRHLYLHDATGRELRTLTAGDWVVTGLVAVDEERRTAYFHGTRDAVVQRHLYAVSLDGGMVQRLTEGEGWHQAVVAPDFSHFVDHWSSLWAAPTLALRQLPDGAVEAMLFEDAGATASHLGLRPPELIGVPNRSGVILQAAVYTPPGAGEGAGPFPLIVAVYGGPHVQRVANQWDLTVDMRAHYLAQQGFVVLKVDNRGSANRGLAFEAALAGHLGQVEVDDQVDAVRFLAQRTYVDGQRVGVYGWSYGGYMTCMLLLRVPDLFKAGVAGAPVTDWDGYDTHYTERYMGQPEQNEKGYRDSAVLAHVAALRGRLMVIHGMVDENVHFRHTARLAAALTAAQKEYDLVVFPEERHMPRGARDLEYLERRLVAHFERNL